MSFKHISLEIVLKNISPRNIPALTKAVHELFGQNLADEIRKIKPKSGFSVDELYAISLSQLVQFIYLYHSHWPVWDTGMIKSWLPNVVKACHWRLSLPLLTLEEASQEGTFLADNLLFYLEKSPKDIPQIRRQRLLNYLSKIEKNEVAKRALRAALPALQKLPSQTIFFQLTPDYQIVLQASIISRYLYEQTAFYVYLYINPQEGMFLEDAWTYVQRYVSRRLQLSSIPDYQQVAQDVVQDALKIFLEKRQTYNPQRHLFLIDKRIRVYLIDLIRSYKLISAQFKKNNNKLYLDEDLEEKLLDPLDIEGNPFGEDSPEQEAINRIVRSCLTEIGERCKELIEVHFLSDYTEPLPYREMVEEINTPLRTIERWMPGCKDDWKMCVIKKTAAQGLRL